MATVAKPNWWTKLAAAYGFTDTTGTTLDSADMISRLNSYFVPAPSDFSAYLTSTQGSPYPDTTRIDILVLGTGHDFVAARGGLDYVSGRAGDDVIYGDDGADILHGGAGVDLIVGNIEGDSGSSKDTASYLEAGAGINLQLLSGISYVSSDGSGSYDMLYGIENIIGSDFADRIQGQNGVNNTLAGSLGNDTVSGGSGNDVLLGGAGNDTLSGEDGNDVLLSGTGVDSIYTGAGQDKVVVEASVLDNPAANRDTVYDFQTGTGGDKLDVSALLLAAGYTGSNAVGDGYITLSTINSTDIKVSFDADGSAGPGSAQHVVTLADASLGSFSTSANLVTTVNSIFYAAILGQSNAKGLSTGGSDNESGVTHLKDGLAGFTGYDEVVSMMRETGTGQPIDIAVGGTTVDGNRNTSYKPEEVWWYPDTGKPGEILLRAVDLLTVQIAEMKARGAVTPVVVWGQGEAETRLMGKASNSDAAMARYKAATLAVFDYIKDHVDEDIQFYIMQTGRYNDDAARALGKSETEIRETLKGVSLVQTAQEDMAIARGDVHLAATYKDLRMLAESDPTHFGTDLWHTDYEDREIIGDRLASFIAADLGYTHVIQNPGPYPIRALADLTFQGAPSTPPDPDPDPDPDPLPVINGTSGDDRLVGPSTGAQIFGYAGADKLIASGGENILVGGLGKDSITLSSGQDTVVFGSEILSDITANSDYITGFTTGAGGDKLDLSAMLSAVGYTGSDPVADGYLRLVADGTRTKLLFDADGFSGGGARYLGMLTDVSPSSISVKDNLIVQESSGTQSTSSTTTTTTVSTAAASGLTIDGTSSADLIIGTLGEDVIHGLGGKDMIVGGAGADSLYGASSTDTFIFDTSVWNQVFAGGGTSTPLAYADVIEDFTAGAGGDKVNLDILLEKAGYTGSDPVSDNYIRVANNSSGDAQLLFDADGGGSGAAKVVAILSGVSASAFSFTDNLDTAFVA